MSTEVPDLRTRVRTHPRLPAQRLRLGGVEAAMQPRQPPSFPSFRPIPGAMSELMSQHQMCGRRPVAAPPCTGTCFGSVFLLLQVSRARHAGRGLGPQGRGSSGATLWFYDRIYVLFRQGGRKGGSVYYRGPTGNRASGLHAVFPSPLAPLPRKGPWPVQSREATPSHVDAAQGRHLHSIQHAGRQVGAASASGHLYGCVSRSFVPLRSTQDDSWGPGACCVTLHRF
jgi:hypothetical protein